jgi:hypothetical protein
MTGGSLILMVQIPQTSNYLFENFQISGTSGYFKKNQIHGQHWCEAHFEPVTMHRIQFPPRWPAPRND